MGSNEIRFNSAIDTIKNQVFLEIPLKWDNAPIVAATYELEPSPKGSSALHPLLQGPQLIWPPNQSQFWKINLNHLFELLQLIVGCHQ